MHRSRVLPLAAAVTLAFAASAAADIGFSTGRQGGSQYPVSVAIAQILEKVPGVGSVTLVPGGGAANIVAVDQGKSEIAITLSMSAVDGLKGQPPYKAPTPNIVQLFALHAFKLVVLVPADSPIKEFKDLVGKKINTGPSGFTVTALAKEIFAKEKMTVDIRYLEPGPALQQFKDGNIDGWFYSPSDIMAPYIDLANSRDIRLVPLPEKLMKEIMAENPSFYRTKWPANKAIYPRLKNQVETLGYPNLIIANKNMVSDDLAYKMTKAIAENITQLANGDPSLEGFDPKDLAVEVGVPIHPGSMKYFKERGWR